MIRFTVQDADTRLDRLLAAAIPGLSRNEAENVIKLGGVRIGGRVCSKKGERPAPSTTIEVDVAVLEQRPPEERARLAAKESDLKLLDRGDDWAVVRKPAGLGSTPLFFGDGLAFSVYASRLLEKEWPEPRALPDAGLVHRLDVGTSGAAVIARTQAALDRCIGDREAGRLFRTYWAIVGPKVPEQGVITSPVAHARNDDTRMVTADRDHRGTPQPAITRYRTLARDARSALVEARIEGGRRHQIRVHFHSLGCPLMGDALYGGVGDPTRLALHATYVELVCPKRGTVRVAAEPGAHFWAFAPALAREV